jgi:hypothetical protein
MSHLSPSEFIDLAEGTLGARRVAHADACDACRAQGAVVRDALRLSSTADDVPEPSPLFWDHLSARVRDGVQSETPGRFGLFEVLWGIRPFHPAVAGLVILVAVVALAPFVRGPNVVQAPTGSVSVSAPGARDVDQLMDSAHVEAWAVISAAAADVAMDEAKAAGMGMQPAAVDRAVTRLTTAELTELQRLLQQEMNRSSE